MTLVTRCPACHAVFRLTGIQLHSHDGDVRCGQCKQVFNGFTELIAVPEAYIQPHALQSNLALLGSKNVVAAPTPVDEAKIPVPADDFGIQQSSSKPSRLWLIPNVLLFLLLFGQILHAYRTEIFIAFPFSRPILNEYCNIIQCEVKLPHHLHLLSLESSDLQVSSSVDPDVVELSAVIRNHAPFPQELPALLLTLTDTNDKPLASRIFTAKDYLDSAADQSVFTARGEIHAQCFLNLNQLNAIGYKLELFYP